MILVIDNYDSFTHNLVHLLREGGDVVEVWRNDRISVPEVLARQPDRVVISPGPGRPEDAGISISLIQALPPEIPLLGVCLGHQALAQAEGGRIVRAPSLVHGKTSEIHHEGRGVFQGLPRPFPAMRYHSLAVDGATLPEALEVTAWLDDADRTIMGLRHRNRPHQGIQFHPESFLTPAGRRIVANFLAPGA